MKNLLPILHKLEDVDIRLLDTHLRKKHMYLFSNWDRHSQSDYHKVGDYYPYKHITRLLEKHVNQPFNHVFHLFCQRFPDYFQKHFHQQFESGYYRRRYNFSWYVDDDGIVRNLEQFTKKPKVLYEIRSWDLKYSWKNKQGHLIKDEHASWWQRDEYERVITKGYIQTFDRVDYRYIRMRKENMQRAEIEQRRTEVFKRKREYTFQTKKELQAKFYKSFRTALTWRHGRDIYNFLTDEELYYFITTGDAV